MNEMVILVDDNDHEIGIEEKIKAHKEGKLHRAFSIFIFNSNGDMLLQKRANSKYHSGGLWTNACCSHPRPMENLEQAAHRRLVEEMGFDCDLKKAFHFIYQAELDHGLTEHEFDHVFFGVYQGEINPNPHEVEDFKWMRIDDVKNDIEIQSAHYTIWFKIALKQILNFSLFP